MIDKISKKNNLTEEQTAYVKFDKLIDTKLIATAGSGKTFTIIQKMHRLIHKKILDSTQILMLTFSRFTRDDFINRIKKHNIDTINENYIKTIDSFAKSIIDPNNEVDVSILSYKFMKYLEVTPAKEIEKNDKLNNIKTIFVDEAQDLNETQYKILTLLKKKNKTIINLIGDPNQNIYQFRGSSDKYLNEFNAKTFYLTYNFRSHQEVVEFSKHLRPNKDMDVICKKDKIDRLPISVIYKDEDDLEENLLTLLNNAEKNNIDLSNFAILAPTRGRMRPDGKSNGLCLISNILFKNKYKFQQFYEEAMDEISSNIQYIPKNNHINILTYMGSKGLEWKYTIIIDAETCLINKNHFTKEKHKNDQYLLYVACSRAINNLFIFTKYSSKYGDDVFHINPWFSLIPNECYRQDNRFIDSFKFPKIKEKISISEERKIGKILDQCTESSLYNLALLCDYGVEKHNSIKDVLDIYEIETPINSSMFISKFMKELFYSYYNISKNLPHRQFNDIENIINLDVIMKNFTPKFLNWFYWNRYKLTWEIFDKEKDTYDIDIVEIIEKNFKRSKELSEHVIFPDCYFKTFILINMNEIKENYEKYLCCKDYIKIRKYLFKIIVLIYSLETQHYYHVLNKGKKFKYILEEYDEIFNKIHLFINLNTINMDKTQVPIYKYEMSSIIDFVNNDGELFDVKCCTDITLKHIIHQLLCNILYNNLDDSKKHKHNINLNFINLITGKITKISLSLTPLKIKKIIDIFIQNKKSRE
jgi:thymidine kinase